MEDPEGRTAATSVPLNCWRFADVQMTLLFKGATEPTKSQTSTLGDEALYVVTTGSPCPSRPFLASGQGCGPESLHGLPLPTPFRPRASELGWRLAGRARSSARPHPPGRLFLGLLRATGRWLLPLASRPALSSSPAPALLRHAFELPHRDLRLLAFGSSVAWSPAPLQPRALRSPGRRSGAASQENPRNLCKKLTMKFKKFCDFGAIFEWSESMKLDVGKVWLEGAEDLYIKCFGCGGTWHLQR
ncbi:uncharacterized protein LOC132649892 [Meriones unguiculatus]|uniref:uncharacterized protein LOC132649892 n=1 Tax=Meriones unguiculatus TaxID=10047 RepID=UPI00293F060F|nr:uncharacterized protein LOC132649892 [Meriones unguiculatus]